MPSGRAGLFSFSLRSVLYNRFNHIDSSGSSWISIQGEPDAEYLTRPVAAAIIMAAKITKTVAVMAAVRSIFMERMPAKTTEITTPVAISASAKRMVTHAAAQRMVIHAAHIAPMLAGMDAACSDRITMPTDNVGAPRSIECA